MHFYMLICIDNIYYSSLIYASHGTVYCVQYTVRSTRWPFWYHSAGYQYLGGTATTGVISLARHCSNIPGSLSGPDDFDTSNLSSNMKTPFFRNM